MPHAYPRSCLNESQAFPWTSSVTWGLCMCALQRRLAFGSTKCARPAESTCRGPARPPTAAGCLVACIIHILLTLACNSDERHVLCRGGCLLAQTMCGHLAGLTCHGPAQPLTPAGCPVAPARGTANWASSTLPTLASARRYIYWLLCIPAEVGVQLWHSTVFYSPQQT